MLSFLPAPLRGPVSVSLFAANTVSVVLPLLTIQIVKLLLPVGGWRRFWSRAQNGIGSAWVSINGWTLGLTNPVRWDVQGVEGFSPAESYLVIANHQSTVDILVLQKVFDRRIPFLKFFLKKELFRVPVLGLAWWSLDYAFLERSGSPRKDREAILRACERFKGTPVSIVNFVEGTRFTVEKKRKQSSPYTRLLKPKAGGLTFALDAMGEQIQTILDVTIAYPHGPPGLWAFLRGDVPEIRVRVKEVPVDEELRGDFAADKQFRRRFVTWLTGLWAEKDEGLSELLR
jgi:1-acyl-sn-glycerol-3-phosphate acyltransferase